GSSDEQRSARARAARTDAARRALAQSRRTSTTMCGIVGYIGPRTASPLLIEGLKRLEYRGYDSAGIVTNNGGGLETRRAKGKISVLENVVTTSPVHGTVGIAHTRWATHGAPNEGNAHPHADCTNTIALVH